MNFLACISSWVWGLCLILRTSVGCKVCTEFYSGEITRSWCAKTSTKRSPIIGVTMLNCVLNHVFKRKRSRCVLLTPQMLCKQDSTNLYNSTLLPHLRGDLWSRGTFHSVLTFIMLLDLIPPKGGRGCLMSPACLESQGCHLIPLCYLLSRSSA